jgi:hypothetical protein
MRSNKGKAHVDVDDSEFVREHLRAPRGRGGWLFCTVSTRRNDYLDHLIQTPPCNSTFAEAKCAAVEIARARGITYLYVCP